MTKTWRCTVWVLSGVCLLFGGLFLLQSTRTAPSVHLRDGSIVRLECVRYQRKTPELPSQAMRWIIAQRDWLFGVIGRPTFSSRPVQSDALVYWISRRDKDTGKFLDLDCLSYATAVDSHGCEFVALPYLTIHAPNLMRTVDCKRIELALEAYLRLGGERPKIHPMAAMLAPPSAVAAGGARNRAR